MINACDNRYMQYANDKKEAFRLALKLSALCHHKADTYERVAGMTVTTDGIHLHTYPPKNIISYVAFPVPFSIDNVIPLVWEWLETAIRPARPDSDGSVVPGYCIFTDGYGETSLGGFVAIAPTWFIYGK